MINSDMPAMPCTVKPEYQYQDSGLTKREHFAGLAMQGLIAAGHKMEIRVAVDSLEMADALLAELEKGND